MYISNSKLVSQILSSGADPKALETVLLVTISLLKKYSRKMKLTSFQEILGTVDAGFVSILQVFIAHDKLHVEDLQEMISSLQQQSEKYQSQFTIVSDKAESLAEYITKRFDQAEITTENSEELGLEVSGEGRWYKRTINQDLDTLLS